MPYYIKRTKAKKKDKPLPLFDKAGITIKKKPDLKAKLDKEFSLFIRLRDAMPNGYFRCISCGQIKPFGQADCGHYFSRTHLATRFDENNCHAECRPATMLSRRTMRSVFTIRSKSAVAAPMIFFVEEV